MVNPYTSEDKQMLRDDGGVQTRVQVEEVYSKA